MPTVENNLDSREFLQHGKHKSLTENKTSGTFIKMMNKWNQNSADD